MENSNLMIFQDSEGKAQVSARFCDDNVWLTQSQLAEIYGTTKPNIVWHINSIFSEGELTSGATVKYYLTVQKEGARQVERNIAYYNLDMIIALGYRISSPVAMRFRRWATERLHEYIQKGFTMDDERLKQGSNRYFRELLQRIRDIRSSERNFYQQVTDIYATATDYNPTSELTRNFLPQCRTNCTMPYMSRQRQRLFTTELTVQSRWLE